MNKSIVFGAYLHDLMAAAKISDKELALQLGYQRPLSIQLWLKGLMVYTGARGCDARHFGPQMIEDGWLSFRQQKLGESEKSWVKLPLHDKLVEELELAPHDALAFILTPYGKTYTQKGFGNWFNDKCRAAGLQGCTAHGLRKAAATIAADNGATSYQLMAMFGWMTEQMATHYTRAANRKTLAAEAVARVTLERNGN